MKNFTSGDAVSAGIRSRWISQRHALSPADLSPRAPVLMCRNFRAGKQVLELESGGRSRRSKMAAVMSAVAAMMLIALLARGSSQVALLPVLPLHSRNPGLWL